MGCCGCWRIRALAAAMLASQMTGGRGDRRGISAAGEGAGASRCCSCTRLPAGLQQWRDAPGRAHAVHTSVPTTHGTRTHPPHVCAGASASIRNALALTRCMGTLVLKSTVSLNDPSMPGWSEVANDLVVNEKTLVGSR